MFDDTKRIWKFVLMPEPATPVTLSVGATVLGVGFQGRTVVLWAEVEPAAIREVRWFSIVGTGGSPPQDGTFVGTAQLATDKPDFPFLVFHVYEVAAEVVTPHLEEAAATADA